MAKYEDYAAGIESEIGDAQAASDQRARDAETGRYIPERFKNKDLTDVIQSYEELEKLNSRQAQDLGSMRKTVDQLLDIQKQQASSPAQEPSKPVSVDDLYVQESDFGSWVQESPYRQRMFQDADSGDFDAAEEILGMYYETNRRQEAIESQKQEEAVQQRQLADATLESGSPARPEMGETYSRNDLMEARLSAKRGDLKAERWLKAHGDSIAKAYEEGRIVD
jgi:hypothetical protein